MKAGIFDPYLDTLGGGERYAMTVVEALLDKGWRVDVFWSDRNIREKLRQKFGLNIERVNYVNYSPWQNNLLKRCKFERNYNFLFYFSDGSIPFMFSKNNILHFQVPFKHVLKNSFKNKLKLRTIDNIVCNSLFTKKVIDDCLKTDSLVVYPPVDVSSMKPLIKKNIILSVGRFSQLLQGKRQDILIDAFIEMIDKFKLKGWRLVLAGGTEVGGSEFVESLKGKIKDYPIEIIENPPFGKLVELYGRATIFWTASGYEIDEEESPERVEHFGMTTVEAMAAGCVPVVLGKGGQKEIVDDGKNGFLWTERNELAEKTMELVEDEKLLWQMSEKAVAKSRNFSKEIFYRKIYHLLV